MENQAHVLYTVQVYRKIEFFLNVRLIVDDDKNFQYDIYPMYILTFTLLRILDFDTFSVIKL